jgi:hypothetical protein
VSRTIATAVLALALAGPAAAQLPPTPRPAQPPVPVQPQPIPPQPPPVVFQPTMPGRLPPANGPRLVVAKVVDGALVWKTTEMAPVTMQMDVPVIENGEQVIRKTTVTRVQQTTKETSLPLDGLKIKDAAGRKIQPLSLEIKLGEGGGVVLHTGPIPPELRALLKDDAILVELSGGGPQFAQPVFIGPPPGGPVPVLPGTPSPPAVRPGGLAPTPAPVPPARVPPAPPQP